MGKLYAVGFGPGGYEHMTAKAIDVIKNADVITGYTTYVEMLKKFFPDKEYVATPMTKEMDRCRMAVDLAAEGKTVAMVSSGDSGIYGMAGILLEIANEKKADVEIETASETKGTKQEQEGSTEEDPSPSLFSEEKEDPYKIDETKEIRVNGKEKTKDKFHFKETRYKNRPVYETYYLDGNQEQENSKLEIFKK